MLEYNHLSNSIHSSESQSIHTDIEEIETAVAQLGLHKAPDAEGIVSEHIINSHPAIMLHIKNLFTMILHHSFVPSAFTRGIITPILKDKQGDIYSVDNYRPITISSVFSKVFEYFLLQKFSPYFLSDSLQFA